jgi:hypothetical protein
VTASTECKGFFHFGQKKFFACNISGLGSTSLGWCGTRDGVTHRDHIPMGSARHTASHGIRDSLSGFSGNGVDQVVFDFSPADDRPADLARQNQTTGNES